MRILIENKLSPTTSIIAFDDDNGKNNHDHYVVVAHDASRYPETLTNTEVAASTAADIKFQSGLIEVVGPNGTQVEDLLLICIDRLKYLQKCTCTCQENANALEHIRKALEQLNRIVSADDAIVDATHDK